MILASPCNIIRAQIEKDKPTYLEHRKTSSGTFSEQETQFWGNY